MPWCPPALRVVDSRRARWTSASDGAALCSHLHARAHTCPHTFLSCAGDISDARSLLGWEPLRWQEVLARVAEQDARLRAEAEAAKAAAKAKAKQGAADGADSTAPAAPKESKKTK